ncbi:uncharacterized protein BDZ99DRAFT_95208 [Mytilinidion resinicola]|uniref:Uncharacterized protein n=1 Tax=Mytilinidion resinicola TaxID=574789 RepID=A0A6A6YCB3_9PEZI|nr:uncharacterized protein BDZ99DRAFT_95208 [Mytilinidion resinicola]KAF2806451.1 hypothetical protein BDZ99DRAFT_95208 [Mytilinidion resinicola]
MQSTATATSSITSTTLATSVSALTLSSQDSAYPPPFITSDISLTSRRIVNPSCKSTVAETWRWRRISQPRSPAGRNAESCGCGASAIFRAFEDDCKWYGSCRK